MIRRPPIRAVKTPPTLGRGGRGEAGEAQRRKWRGRKKDKRQWGVEEKIPKRSEEENKYNDEGKKREKRKIK